MSYILDALKKSAQERQRGTVPTVHSVQVPLTSRPRRRSRWLHLAALALLLNAGLLVWWLRPWQSELPGSGAPAATGQQTGGLNPALARAPVEDRQADAPQAPQVSKPGLPEAPGTPQPPAAVASPPAPAQTPLPVDVARDNRQAPARSAAPAAGIAHKTVPGVAVKATRDNAGARPRKEPATAPAAAEAGRKANLTVQRVEANAPKVPAAGPAPPAAVGAAPEQPSPATGQAPDWQAQALAQQRSSAAGRETPEGSNTSVNQHRLSSVAGQAATPGPASEPVQAEQGVPDLRQLPLPVQKGLPSLSFSMLVYSDKPADRMVNINGRMMHEGQEVSPGLKLEAITPSGAILNFQGHRFRKGVL
jgi:general secretion pathway protein B